MSWSTIFGNNGRNSYVAQNTNVGSQLWVHEFDSPEVPYGPPVVSVGGFIWIVTEDTVGFDFTFYLYCFNPDGTVKSKTALQTDDATPHTSGNLTTTAADECLVPWTSSLKAFDVLGNLLWEFSRTTVDTSVRHFDAPAIDGSGNIVLIWTSSNGGGTAAVTHVTILDSGGNFTSEFVTGYGLLLNNAQAATIDATGIYISEMTYPVSGSTHVFLNKFDFTGVLLWQYDFGTYLGFHRVLWPSVAGGTVAVYGAPNGGSGFVSVFLFDATTGALLWTYTGAGSNDYSNGNPNPAIGADGTVYAGHFLNTDDANLRGLDGSDGSLLWTFTLGTDPQIGPTVPVIGNDGFTLWANGELLRVSQSSGTDAVLTSGLSSKLQPALVEGVVYVASGLSSPTFLYAYETITVPTMHLRSEPGWMPGGGGHATFLDVTPIGNGAAGILRDVVHSFARAMLYDASCINFQARIARKASGSDVSCDSYGLPTNLTICNRITAGGYWLEANVADLNGAKKGDKIQLKITRKWNDPLNTSESPCSLEEVALEYDVT